MNVAAPTQQPPQEAPQSKKKRHKSRDHLKLHAKRVLVEFLEPVITPTMNDAELMMHVDGCCYDKMLCHGLSEAQHGNMVCAHHLNMLFLSFLS
jgi:hypothetical protein